MTYLLCRASDELEAERTARQDAEDVVSQLQEQLAEVREAEVSARQAAETRLASLSQEYNSMKSQVSLLLLHTTYLQCLCGLKQNARAKQHENPQIGSDRQATNTRLAC